MQIVIVGTESHRGNKSDVGVFGGDFLENTVEKVISSVLLLIAERAVCQKITESADQNRNVTEIGITAQGSNKALKACLIRQTALFGDIALALMPEDAFDFRGTCGKTAAGNGIVIKRFSGHPVIELGVALGAGNQPDVNIVLLCIRFGKALGKVHSRKASVG